MTNEETGVARRTPYTLSMRYAWAPRGVGVSPSPRVCAACWHVLLNYYLITYLLTRRTRCTPRRAAGPVLYGRRRAGGGGGAAGGAADQSRCSGASRVAPAARSGTGSRRARRAPRLRSIASRTSLLVKGLLFIMPRTRSGHTAHGHSAGASHDTHVSSYSYWLGWRHRGGPAHCNRLRVTALTPKH